MLHKLESLTAEEQPYGIVAAVVMASSRSRRGLACRRSASVATPAHYALDKWKIAAASVKKVSKPYCWAICCCKSAEQANSRAVDRS